MLGTSHDPANTRPALHDDSSLLVVEDDPDIRQALAELLTDEGFSVATAANGAEALSTIHGMPRPPCVILLDLMMPVMNGWQFLSAAAEDARLKKVPIVVVSAIPDRAPDVAYVMPKPIDIDRLLEVVRGLC